ncbi:MAG: hypothetical protein JWN94_3261 [Betaproteobacteria bacterium]|nr:hypothetical protein [Betaproteobacteria bacterium]
MEIQVTYITANSRGQQQRDQQRVSGDLIEIGRGSQCQIHLKDVRIALQHARLQLTESGATIEAEAGRILVNGRAVEVAKLAAGDRIDAGPYRLVVEEPPAGISLALAVQLMVPLESRADARRFTIQAPRLSKRRLSYIGFLGTLLLCLAVPVAADFFGYPVTLSAKSEVDSTGAVVRLVSERFQQAWNPGPVAESHQPFADDCRSCHRFPFIQVRDLSCVACHTTIKEHVPKSELTGEKGQEFLNTRCAECHRDHKGPVIAPRSQEQCADCHRDLSRVATDATSKKVTDFRSDHPAFRVSLLDADHPEAIRRVRQSERGEKLSPDMVERSNLKFNHKLHVDPGGVRDPEGKRDAKGARDARGRRTVLKCADCHRPSEGGRLMAPISMEMHCQRCHSLAFEPQVTSRQVVHGDAAAMATMLREFYARLVLGDVPPGVNPPRDLPRMRPGAVLTYQDRQEALRIADQKANLVLREMFDVRQVCSTCHTVSHRGDGSWTVAQVRLAQVWMPQALFNHDKHKTEPCEKCHNVSLSTAAKDVAMPDIANCRKCHVGASKVAGKVTSDCATCHKFHSGRDYWHGVIQAQMLPRGTK